MQHEGKADLTVFLGDYFDDFYDSEFEALAMAQWLKENIHNDKRVFLLGNHDFQYMLPAGTIMCSGYTAAKHRAINSVLTYEDWNKFEYFFAKDNFWFSHAGITEQWFLHPMLGVSEETIKRTLDEVKENVRARNGNYNPVWAVDRHRGGEYDKGGLLWNHSTNSEFFPGITQVIGHTPIRSPFAMSGLENSKNIFMDTHLQNVCIIDTETKEIEWFDVEY